ncbi:Rossmann fold domain-containing protein [Novosphingobium sp. BL-52-GroH]|uniref:Rossmann fold domain-containing protein n=1 Tax=Novosphingobium sp. BL-52-GroH TaxID=3349877 RepID=UPI00384CCE30
MTGGAASELLHLGPLSGDALEAAADFHARLLPSIEATLLAGADPLTLVFLPAGHDHRTWRLAAVQGLARRFAPSRINAVESDEAEAIAAASRWLGGAGGVTGQLLPLDGTGASGVLYPCT